MSVNVRADKKDRKLRSKQRGECCSVFFWVREEFFLFPVFFVEKDWKQKKLSPGSSKKTTIHRKHHRCRHYPRSPQLQCCAWKCRTLWTKMVVFFEGRHTHNSEYNIELGDGGNMTCMVWNFIGWLFFLKNPVFQYVWYLCMYIYICVIYIYICMYVCI